MTHNEKARALMIELRDRWICNDPSREDPETLQLFDKLTAEIDALVPEETANWKIAPIDPGPRRSMWEPGGFPPQRMFQDEDARIAMGEEFPSYTARVVEALTRAGHHLTDAVTILQSLGNDTHTEQAAKVLETIWAERNRVLTWRSTPPPSPADDSRSDTKSPAPEDR